MTRLIPPSLAQFCVPAGLSGPMPVDQSAPADMPSVVTAFFDTGRAGWRVRGGESSRFRRDAQDYLAAFERLARLKNPMVIFTEPRFADAVLAARRAAGLIEQTRVFTIDCLFEAPPVAALLRAIAARMTPRFRRFVWQPDLPEFNEARYVGLVCMKQVFVTTAIELGAVATEETAWLDFGYCRKDDHFDPAEPWRFDAGGRMNLFHIVVLDETPIYEVVRSGMTWFLANQMIGPTSVWADYADDLDAALQALVACDLVDDEQTLMFIAWRAAPEKYRLHPLPPMGWFSTLQIYRTGAPPPAIVPSRGKVHANGPAWWQEFLVAFKRERRRLKALARLALGWNDARVRSAEKSNRSSGAAPVMFNQLPRPRRPSWRAPRKD